MPDPDDPCPRGGQHEKGVPKREGNLAVTRCAKCGAFMDSETADYD